MYAAAATYARQSDESLLAAAKEGDDNALGHLLSRYRGPITGYLRRRLNNDTRADDLWSTVVYRVLRNRARFDPTRPFARWIFSIASNLLKNEYRDDERHRDIERGDVTWARPENPSPLADELLERAERHTAVHAALAAIPESQRIPLELFVLHDQHYAQISAATGVPIGTVKSRLHRGRHAFARLFRERFAATLL